MKRESPLKAIFDIRKSELPLPLLMLSYFFLVITSKTAKGRRKQI